ncbi:adenine/guanine phosphoribosyltransferase-like PRPP-binding protein [Sphingomonas sp. SORGH_AS 950]|uniref:hypothetical protein n=1 Tax=Sphingomonas sp. SORGH_AS_0950 TaxID=3041792 RepID=UPI00277D2F65|nr:hypothetical protein [Sphingomonas sp. SORGH_AS_0950]MDQ1157605.1 adenine/guanine phosphoribosyltransferase-like PRPP-binding protein [Sphingomonas sp. SORGH_AS_0950]
MTDPIDHDLARLSRGMPPAALADMEQRVAATIAAAPVPVGTLSVRGMALAAAVAMVLGLAGGGVMAGRSEARERPGAAVVALGGGLAPSTLLLGR